MCEMQKLRVSVEQILTAAAEEICGVFQRSIAEIEEKLSDSLKHKKRNQRLPDTVHQTNIRIPPEQQGRSPHVDQEEPEPPHIKEEKEEEQTMKLLLLSGDSVSATTPVPFLQNVHVEFTLNHVEQLLKEAPEKHADKIISEPPIRPQGGDAFLYRANTRNTREKTDFKYDQYRWISKGSNNHSNRMKKQSVIKRYYYIKDPNGKNKESLCGFRRHVFNLADGEEKDLYLIHYVGDASLAKDVPHGNSKSSTKIFLPTKKSVQTNISEKADFLRKPQELYKHFHQNQSDNFPAESIAVSQPRDKKQVENELLKRRKDNRLSNDEIFSMYELALHTNVVKKITLWPNLLVYVGLDSCIELAQRLIRLSRKDKSLPQLLSYDTTFNLGDFYVSPLVMRNVMIQGDPIFPVMFLLHDRKFEKDHEDFLTEALNLIQNGTSFSDIPILTDREKDITAPLQSKFPGLTNILCRNHILKDVEAWVKKNGGKKDDIKVLKDHIEQVLDSTSVEDFEYTWNKLHVFWSQGFLDYVQSSLKDDMVHHACRYTTSRFPAFHGTKTATNNISESFSYILKEEANWKEWPADTMVLILYYLQTYYMYEFRRAGYGLGNHRLKEKFKEKLDLIQNTDLPEFASIQDIVASIKDKYGVASKVEKTSPSRLTQRQLAKICVDKGQIGFCSQTSSFTVLNIDGKGVSAVRLFPRPSSCSCPSTGLCYHVLAVSMAIGDKDFDDNRTYSFSIMKRKRRGKESKSGRKKARKHDYDYDVEAAEDSIVALDDEMESQIKTSSPFQGCFNLATHQGKVDESTLTSPQSKVPDSQEAVKQDTTEKEPMEKSQLYQDEHHHLRDEVNEKGKASSQRTS